MRIVFTLSKNGFPKCPVCEASTLIPLSAVYGTSTPAPPEKTFAHWICPRCGFYIGTGGLAGYNVPKDISTAMIPEIAEKFKLCKQAYEKAVKEGWFSWLDKKQ